jgi:hypothetical protein
MARKGIQPVVKLTANGRERAEVEVGEVVEFIAETEVPPSAGAIVAAAWDFDGAGQFPVVGQSLDGSARVLTLYASHAFNEPGTYFPAILVGAQREGDTTRPYARVDNLGRVRVVVR